MVGTGHGPMARTKISAKRSRRRPAPNRTSAARATEFVVAGLAHDIRTPLTGILALAELLATSDLGERERRWVAALKSNADHLAALTTLVVDAARMSTRAFVPRRDVFDLRRLIEAAATSIRTRAEAAGLACTVDVAPDLPAQVVGDPVRLRAAFENLIDNAVKFTERGTVGLRVSARTARRPRLARGKAASAPRIALEFAVSDSGIGLSKAEIGQVFKPFSQANASIYRRFGGAGLGLALVKRIAKALGGDLTVDSKPKKGSTFRLTVTVEQAATPTAVDAGAARNASSRPGRSLRVLHVEDNPHGRVVINTILTNFGHRVDFASRGEAAIDAVRGGGYDLVLMDVQLPGMDGFEVTRRIRALDDGPGRVPIIGLSGHDAPADRQTADLAGMNGYLAKPITALGLAEAIGQVTRASPGP